MRISFYTIDNFKVKTNNKIYNAQASIQGYYETTSKTIQEFEEELHRKFLYDKEPFNHFKEDIKFYMITDKNEIFGVLSFHKGWTFIDCAERDEKVIIKSALPNVKDII